MFLLRLSFPLSYRRSGGRDKLVENLNGRRSGCYDYVTWELILI